MTQLGTDLTTTTAHRLRPLYIVGALALAIVGGCSSSGSGGAETSPSTAVATTEVVPTTEVAPPTLAPTTTAEPVLAPPIVPAGAFLRENGLGEFDFGALDTVVLPGLLLAVSSDRLATFPVPIEGGFLSDDGSESFVTAFGREICFLDGGSGTLCTYFAGVAPESLLLAGWYYTAVAGVEGRLFSASAVTVNILATSVPSMPVPQGACYSYTTVSVDGIGVDLLSASDTWFGTYGDDGSWIPAVPQPADARVTAMYAGSRFFAEGEGGDC